jgi:RNA methyltransferase, TrmH family
MPSFVAVASRSNPTLVRARRLIADPQAYRKLGQVWLEGEHLLRAARERGWPLHSVLVSDEHAEAPALRPLLESAGKVLRVERRLWHETSGLEAAAPVAALVAMPLRTPLQPGLRTIVLDRIQDPGNLGSILRTAAAFGVEQVLALRGCAAPWSPKVVRAAMGAHFALRLHEEVDEPALEALDVPLVGTSSHDGVALTEATLPEPAAWVFGHEGQGIAEPLLRRCTLRVRIPQPGGEESINVAAAAAVCLYEAMRRRGAVR